MTIGTLPPTQGLYDPANEHDACGVGFVANVKGRKSHEIIQQGLRILENLTHRGAVGADPSAGDGAGLLIQIPDEFLRQECQLLGIDLPEAGSYGVGMLFLPQHQATRSHCEQLIEQTVVEEGQTLLGWRDVPTNNSGLGESVKLVEPVIRQVFVSRGMNCPTTDDFERKLFVIRKRVGNAIRESGLDGSECFYVPSMSARTLCYKGMLLANQVNSYYSDLNDERLTSALALVHQRFSTNTFPSWDLAHPFRMIAHNGEINTMRGNINWMNARRHSMASSCSEMTCKNSGH
jgi:glutamate synthase (NADPH/NADH) large chain